MEAYLFLDLMKSMVTITTTVVVMRRINPATEEAMMIIRKLFWLEKTGDDSLALLV